MLLTFWLNNCLAENMRKICIVFSLLFSFLNSFSQIKPTPPGTLPKFTGGTFNSQSIGKMPAVQTSSAKQETAPTVNPPAFYIPKKDDPDKVILLNFNVFQNDSGEENFQNTETGLKQLKVYCQYLNDFYASNPPPSDPIPGVHELSKTYIRFELVGIYFYRNSKLLHSINGTELINEIKKTDSTRLNELNICFTNGKYGNAAGISIFPSFNMKDDMWIILLNFYHKGNDVADGNGTGTLAHEMGHVLDLLHTYNGGGAPANCASSANDPEYLDDVFGPWPGNCPQPGPDKDFPWAFDTSSSTTDGRTNNMMGGFKSCNYFSPKQIGMMHRALTIKTPKRYLK